MNDAALLEIALDPTRWKEPGAMAAIKARMDDNDSFSEMLAAALPKNKAGIDYVKFGRMLHEELGKPVTARNEKTVRQTTTQAGKVVPVKQHSSLQAVSATDLVAMDIPPLEYLIQGILPAIGLTCLGALPKMFKSFLALYICLAICLGLDVLGRPTKKAACLYLDLESSLRRPRERIRQIVKDGDVPDNLFIVDGSQHIGRIGDGLEEQLEEVLAAHPDIGLIVIDVFKKVRPEARKTQTLYDKDYEDAQALQRFAQAHSLAILIVHHTRKMRDPYDPFNELGGSTGLMGALDAAWIITKEQRSDDEATLHTTGRDLESMELRIRFEKSTMRWEYVGTVEEMEARSVRDEYENSPIIRTVRKLVKQGGGTWSGSATEIKSASRYLGYEIYLDAGRIGRVISDYERMLRTIDGITYTYKRAKEGRRYIFTVDTVNAGFTVNADFTVAG